MAARQLLIEQLSGAEANIIAEAVQDGKTLYLAGRIMAGESANLNKRIYPRSEIEKAVARINEKAKAKEFVAGELNHPEGLTIDLKNVSHIITEAWMEGDNAMGKCKILNTPSGMIVQALVEGGLRPGVSSRGTGSVTNEGVVSDFDFVTLDIVAQPSGPGCTPNAIRESVENNKIMTLAEAIVHDKAAQKYLKIEIQKFLESLMKGAK